MKRTPEEFAELLKELKDLSAPPVESWHPEVEVEVDMEIDSEGHWLYQGRPIARDSIVRMFSSILIREDDGEYYLVTPVEKARIKVEDAPFVVIALEEYSTTEGGKEEDVIVFSTNIGEKYVLSADYPLSVTYADRTGETIPYLELSRGLSARVGRTVFYELVELATQEKEDGISVLNVYSKGCKFTLGEC